MKSSLPEICFPFLLRRRRRRLFWVMVCLIVLTVSLWSFFRARAHHAVANQAVAVVLSDAFLASPYVLERSDLRTRLIPRKYLPDQFFLFTKDVIGQTITKDLIPGEVINPRHLGPPRPLDSISSQFDHHFAFTLSEDWLASPLPQVQMHDRIDLLVSHPDPSVSPTQTIVKQAEIIAIKQSKGSPTTMTLNLSQMQSEKILLARAMKLPMQILVRPFGALLPSS